MYYLYILKSLKTGKLYTGTTSNLDRRVYQHNSGESKSTRSGVPYTLVYYESFETLSEARKKEWELKYTPWGGKLKKKLVEVDGP